LDVRYSLKDGESFKPEEQGSPGQKTAALLAFILSYGNEPLVLDQPEDDLDNHLIYDLIVKHIREIKQQRQVLIVTHNANIVVNGDAENIVALDVKKGQTCIVTQGGIQDTTIREEICKIMEGGKEAFEQRYRRIIVANA
jgi:ABC-type Mn2+/Zn2+ transport system ATPase subunit